MNDLAYNLQAEVSLPTGGWWTGGQWNIRPVPQRQPTRVAMVTLFQPMPEYGEVQSPAETSSRGPGEGPGTYPGLELYADERKGWPKGPGQLKQNAPLNEKEIAHNWDEPPSPAFSMTTSVSTDFMAVRLDRLTSPSNLDAFSTTSERSGDNFLASPATDSSTPESDPAPEKARCNPMQHIMSDAEFEERMWNDLLGVVAAYRAAKAAGKDSETACAVGLAASRFPESEPGASSIYEAGASTSGLQQYTTPNVPRVKKFMNLSMDTGETENNSLSEVNKVQSRDSPLNFPNEHEPSGLGQKQDEGETVQPLTKVLSHEDIKTTSTTEDREIRRELHNGVNNTLASEQQNIWERMTPHLDTGLRHWKDYRLKNQQRGQSNARQQRRMSRCDRTLRELRRAMRRVKDLEKQVANLQKKQRSE